MNVIKKNYSFNKMKADSEENERNEANRKDMKKEEMEAETENIAIKNIEELIERPSLINEKSIGQVLKMIDENSKKKNYSSPPLTNIAYNLVKFYIESNLDETEDKGFLYYEVFKKLKLSFYMQRAYLIPIYEYFSEILQTLKKHGEEFKTQDSKFLKFHKVYRIWKLFYGESLKSQKIILQAKKRLQNIKHSMNVNVLFKSSKNRNDLNRNVKWLQIKDYNNKIQLLLQKNIDINVANLDSMIININKNKIKIEFRNNKSETIYEEIVVVLSDINKIILLENFYGEIFKIEIVNGEIYETIDTMSKENKSIYFDISFEDLTNYLDYQDIYFDLIDSLGGLKQLIPFIFLINEIYKNKNITSIGTEDKTEFLKLFIIDILGVIHRYFKKYNLLYRRIKENKTKYEKLRKKFKKYMLFAFYLLFHIDYELLPKSNSDYFNTDLKEKIDLYINEIIVFMGNFQLNFGMSLISEYLAGKDKDSFLKIIKGENLKNQIFKYFQPNEYHNISQIYRHFMKELFIYNRFWSKKELFFGDNKSDKLKYKQLFYYTRNFQKPILYPVLEFERNFPKYKDNTDKGDNAFLHKKELLVNYNFDLSENEITTEILNINKMILAKGGKQESKAHCCLIKLMYHVKGIMTIYKNNDNTNSMKNEKKQKNDNNEFEINFIADSDNSNNVCSYMEYKYLSSEDYQKFQEKGDNLCCGSPFIFFEKEYNKRLSIKSKNIMFAIVRIYNRKTSGLEIFTYKPYKSYYFNFKEIININNIKKEKDNILINEFNRNKNFRLIDNGKECSITLYYNIYYIPLLTPFIRKNNINIKKMS